MNKITAVLPIYLLLFICSCQQHPAQPPPVSPNPPQTYLIPEAGIRLQFPVQPQFSRTAGSTYSDYFSETRSYDCIQPYRLDTVSYGMHAGVYYRKAISDSSALLTEGLKALLEMIKNTQGATVLVDEKTQFFGLAAYRIKIHVDVPKPFYVSLILFARGPYCVELSAFDAAVPGEKNSTWKDNPFFQTVAFTDPVPLSVIRQPHEESDNCLLFPCYLKEQQMIAWFPEAPLVYPVEVKHGLKMRKYQIAPYEKNTTLFYAMEFYEGMEPQGTLSDSVLIARFLKVTIPLIKFSEQEKLISFERILYKGKIAIDLHSTAVLAPNPDRIREINIHSRIFVHRGRIVRAITYREGGYVENYPAICFLEWVMFL